MKKILLLSISIFLMSQTTKAQTTIDITASKDNTLYQNANGSLSNGVGAHLFSGRTQRNGVRRAVVQFDLSSLPPNAVIDSVELFLTVNRNVRGGTDNINVHALTADWGEGSSNAPGQEGGGTAATTGDATWIHTFSSTSLWSSAGGDFNATASASTTAGGTGTIAFRNSQLNADVSNWLANPTQNYGWIVIVDENSGTSARRFSSKDGSGTPPTLRVYYLTTGLNERNAIEDLKIYPIPAEDYLVIDLEREAFSNQIRVFDLTGKVIIESGLQMDNRLDVSALKSGIYFLELRTANGNRAVTKKFVKN